MLYTFSIGLLHSAEEVSHDYTTASVRGKSREKSRLFAEMGVS